jgi:butyrate kinase
MSINVLATNLGGTSTKVAYFEDDEMIFKTSIYHHGDELAHFDNFKQQIDYRLESILDLLEERNVDIQSLSIVSSRAGALPPVNAGAYEINQTMIDFHMNYDLVDHPTLIGTTIAQRIADMAGPDVKAMIYDAESLDQLQDIARITGSKEIPKLVLGATLNVREVSRRAAEKLNQSFDKSNFIVIQLGSGSTVSGMKNGRLVDLVSDDEGPFSVNRVGGQQLKQIVKMCYEHTEKEMDTILRKEGGLYSYLGTSDGVEVEEMINNGDEEAALVFEALAYQAAKSAGEMAVAIGGEVDAVVISGGLAHSEMMVDWIKKWTRFIAPAIVYPGEFEMEALGHGGYRVVTGQEPLQEFIDGNMVTENKQIKIRGEVL